MEENKGLIIVGLFFLVIIVLIIRIETVVRKKAEAKRIDTELTNEQIVEKSKYCIENGLSAIEVYKHSDISTVGSYVVDVRCTNKSNPLINQGKKSNATVIVNELKYGN